MRTRTARFTQLEGCGTHITLVILTVVSIGVTMVCVVLAADIAVITA
jgi:hypothetical protein